MILVAGGTGRLGSELVARLVRRNEQVRVLTRDPRRADHLPPVEVVRGDIRRAADVAAAVRGADAVVSAVHGFADWRASPATVDRDGNRCLVEAADATGAHVVLVSVLGASTAHPLELFRMKAAAELLLRQAGIPWSIVRAGAFLELYTDLMRRTAGRSGRPLIFGHGQTPIEFASVGDVAAAVDRALTDPDSRGQVVDVVSETLSFDQLALRLEPVLGPGVRRSRHVPRPVLRALALATGTPPGRQAAAALVMDGWTRVPAQRPISVASSAATRSK